MLRSLISQTSSGNLHLLHRSLVSLLTHSRAKSKTPTNKRVRVRDHDFDNYIQVDIKMLKVQKFQDLVLAQRNSMIAISLLDTYARRIGFKRFEAGEFILKYCHIFEIFEHPVQRVLYCRLTREAHQQIKDENEALLTQLPEAALRLRKLLMLSCTGRLRLEHVRIARKEFGLPDDFESSVVLGYPQYFRLFDATETRNKYIELVEKDPGLAVCAIERVREKEYRQKGVAAEDTRFSFVIKFPHGFKGGKNLRASVFKWQRLPYWSPYEDVSGYDLRSREAQRSMEKRAVAMIHEMLSLSVEKRLTMERIAQFREAMYLPPKMKDFLLKHQGIFYISTRGNHGKMHTVFLREAYRRGVLVEPNSLYLARGRLVELIISSRRARVDPELGDYRRGQLLDGRRDARRDYRDEKYGDYLAEDECRQGRDTRKPVNSARRDYRDDKYGDYIAEDECRQGRDTRKPVNSDVDHGSDSDYTDSDNKSQESTTETDYETE